MRGSPHRVGALEIVLLRLHPGENRFAPNALTRILLTTTPAFSNPRLDSASSARLRQKLHRSHRARRHQAAPGPWEVPRRNAPGRPTRLYRRVKNRRRQELLSPPCERNGPSAPGAKLSAEIAYPECQPTQLDRC